MLRLRVQIFLYRFLVDQSYKIAQPSTATFRMSLRVFLLLVITSMVMCQEMSMEKTTSVEEKTDYAGFWGTLAKFALSEDSFKAWFLNTLEWVVFLVAETMFRVYF